MNCYTYPYRNQNCNTCPKTQCSGIIENTKRINKQTGTLGSLALYRRKALTVSKIIGQDASFCCFSVGGPGDKKTSIEGTCPGNNCKGVTYRLPIAKTRTANKGKKGVDVKHNSYDRYLAKRVGKVLRNENKQFNKHINTISGWHITRRAGTHNQYEYKQCKFESKCESKC